MSAASWLMGTTHCNSTVSLPTAMRSSASLSPGNSSMRMAFAVHFSGARTGPITRGGSAPSVFSMLWAIRSHRYAHPVHAFPPRPSSSAIIHSA